VPLAFTAPGLCLCKLETVCWDRVWIYNLRRQDTQSQGFGPLCALWALQLHAASLDFNFAADVRDVKVPCKTPFLQQLLQKAFGNEITQKKV